MSDKKLHYLIEGKLVLKFTVGQRSQKYINDAQNFAREVSFCLYLLNVNYFIFNLSITNLFETKHA